MSIFSPESEIYAELSFVANVMHLFTDFFNTDLDWLLMDFNDELLCETGVQSLINECRGRAELKAEYQPIYEELLRRYSVNKMPLLHAMTMINHINNNTMQANASSMQQDQSLAGITPTITLSPLDTTINELDHMLNCLLNYSNNPVNVLENVFNVQENYFQIYDQNVQTLVQNFDNWSLNLRKIMQGDKNSDLHDLTKVILNDMDVTIGKLNQAIKVNKRVYNVCLQNISLSDEVQLKLASFNDNFTKFESVINQLILVFEEQPICCFYPINIITKTKFEIVLRLLGFRDHLANPQFQLNLQVFVADYNDFLLNGYKEYTNIWSKNWEIDRNSENIVIKINDLVIKKRPKHSQSGISVCEQRYILVVKCDMTLDYRQISIWTHSMPFTIVTKRENESFATNLWDLSFGSNHAEFYRSPSQVSWDNFYQFLSRKFLYETETPLTEEHAHFLYCKLFNLKEEKVMVSWEDFTAKKFGSQSHPFSFWEWFNSILLLLKDGDLARMWANNLIKGFISDFTSKELLSQSQPGTFLLRFSETFVGTISIIYKDENGEIVKIKPWNGQELKFMSLAERIINYDDIQFLYPNIDKQNALKGYWEEKSGEQTGARYGYITPVVTLLSRSKKRINNLANYVYNKLK